MRFNILIILNISFHGPIQHPIVFHLSTFGIQCIFLTNQQWACETRVGVYDWIAGGEVQVGNTGRVTLRRSLPQLPHVGERFTWLNLISFPLCTYSAFKNIYLSRAEQTFCWNKLTRWCKTSLTILIKDTLKGFVVVESMRLDTVDSVCLVHKHHLKGVTDFGSQYWTYRHHDK